jgi:starch synthase
MRILIIAAEAAPFAKTGGLADVAGSLPKSLAALGHDVRVVMPAYQGVEEALRTGRWGVAADDTRLRVPVGGGLVDAGVLRAVLPDSAVPVYFIAERHLFARPEIYGYPDDGYRFAFFSRAALDLLVGAWGWRPDVVSVHDWHATPAIAWLATSGQLDERYRALPTVLTIHNLRHQGRTNRQVLAYLGVDSERLLEEGPGEVNFMARGIFHATMITTVSPTYAHEILTPEYGERLDSLLRYRHFDVHGILNGLDYEVWNPAADAHLAAPFDAGRLDDRRVNKRALQQRLGLPEADVPLVAMVTRLDAQKGLDITGHVTHLLLNAAAGEAQFVVLGSGAAEYEDMFRHLAGYHRDRMAAVLRYDAALAPLVYAGSDIFLMPSHFEPCGLGQMIAMRYGSVPVVRATGGLVDTVREGVSGFLFADYSVEAFWGALSRALETYRTAPAAWQALQRGGMAADFSWTASARGYQQVFDWAVSRARGW